MITALSLAASYPGMMSRRKLTKRQQAAWARVRILLNLRDITAATAAAIEASAATEWDRFGRYGQGNAAMIYSTDEMPLGWCWFEPQNYRVLIARDTFRSHVLGRWLYRYCGRMTQMREPGFHAYDRGIWRDLEELDELAALVDEMRDED